MTELIRRVQEYTEETYTNLVEEYYTYEDKIYYTFRDKSIVPTYLTRVASRSEVNVLQDFTDITGKTDSTFPAFGASMSFMREKFANSLGAANGRHILPRVGISDTDMLEMIDACDTPIGVSVGLKTTKEQLQSIITRPQVKYLSIDIAHGATHTIVPLIKRIKDVQPITSGIIVGNIGSLEGFIFTHKLLTELGIEQPIIKIGVGPGSACTTRVNTGVGLGQLTLLEDIWARVNSINLGETEYSAGSVKIISDGGVNNPGDFAKALTRSHGVMMGKMFAGSSFEPEVIHGNSVELFGMASSMVAGKDSYIEGGSTEVNLEVLRSAEEIAGTLEDGLRSAMTYVNAGNLAQFKKARLAVNSNAATLEGGLH